VRKPEPQDRPRLPSVAGFSFVPFVIFCSKKSTMGQAFIAGTPSSALLFHLSASRLHRQKTREGP